MAILPFQNATPPDLGVRLSTPVDTGSWWMPIAIRRMRAEADIAGRRDLLANRELELRQGGLGVDRANAMANQMSARAQLMNAQSGVVGTLADANLTNIQAKSAASELALVQKFSDPQALADFQDGMAAARMGISLEDYQTAKRAQTAADNAQGAMAFNVQSSINGILSDFNARARQMVGPNASLFSAEDAEIGLGEYQKMIAGGATEDEALRGILGLATREAKRRFMVLTSPEAVSQSLPAGPAGPSLMGRIDAGLSGLGARVQGALPLGLMPDLTRQPGMMSGRLGRGMASIDSALSGFGSLFNRPDLTRPEGQ